MRVLVVHNRYRSAQPSGENSVVDYEAALLAEHGCVVERFEADSDEIASWSMSQRATLPGRVVWSPAAAKGVKAAIARFEPDVVHFHNTFPLLSPAAIRAAKSTGVPVVLTLHNFRPICAAGTFTRGGRVCEDCLHRVAPFGAVRHGCYRESRTASLPLVAMSAVHRKLGTWTEHVDALLFPSEFARAKYVEAGWPARKCFVKYNTAPDTEGLRSGVGQGFVCVSRLSWEKGVDLLVDAWREAFPDDETTLTVIGSGPDEHELKQRAAGIASIEFAGRLSHEDTIQRIARARALVIPSRCFEVFPRVVAEAYSVGVPVIASRIGSLAEVVDDGHTGLHVELGSPRSLARALQRLETAASEALVLGRAARRAYDERYGPRASADDLLRAYASVCRTPGAVAQHTCEEVKA
jgi:glycosyltransferase involved in cell wall biosynthesis